MTVHTLGPLPPAEDDARGSGVVTARVGAIQRLTGDLYRLDTGLLYDQVFAELARIDPAVLFERVFANLARLRSAQLSQQAFTALRISDTWPIMEWTMANLSRLETARLYGQVSVTLSKVSNGFHAAGSFVVLLHEGLVELGWFLDERAGDPAAEAVARDLARLTGSLPSATSNPRDVHATWDPATSNPRDVHATWDPWFRTGLFIAAALLVAAEGADGPVGPGGGVRATRMVDLAAGLVSLVLAYDTFRDLAPEGYPA